MGPHLNNDQIDEILSLALATDKEGAPPDCNSASREHLAVCEECETRVREQVRLLERLAILKSDPNRSAGSQCPPEAVWVEFAAGVETTGSDLLLSHATCCDHCGTLLRQAVEDLKDDLTAEEESRLAGLSTSTRRGQARLAEELAQKTKSQRTIGLDSHRVESGEIHPQKASVTRPHRVFIHPSLRWAAFATLTVALMTMILLRTRERNSLSATNHLLAQAYTEDRTLELRIPDAQWSKIKISRSGDGSHAERPIPLLQAETYIAAKRGIMNRDSGWLVAAARADLLEGNYDSAVHSLSQAIALSPDRWEADLDLATAYFERAKGGNPRDYVNAVEAIDRAFGKAPSNPTVLFNRALIYDQASYPSQAVNIWNLYLAIDPNGPWAKEAQLHLDDVKRRITPKQIDHHNGAMFKPEDLLENANVSISNDFIDTRIEIYQRVALIGWLQDLTRYKATDSVGLVAERAIRRVAFITSTRHGDRFLHDLLDSQVESDSSLSSALNELSAAIEANESGGENRAFELAELARRAFSRARSRPGILMAQFEQAYALQFSSKPAKCLALARLLVQEARDSDYPWLEAQSLIEEGFCSNMTGDLNLALRALQEAETVATKANFEEASERALVGEAAMQWQSGSEAKAWEYLFEGLKRYWNNPVSDVRGSSIYALMDFMAEESQQWDVQEAALKESLLVDQGNDQLYRAHTLSRLAGSQLILHEPESARENLLRAKDIYHAATDTPSTRSQELLVSINVAKAELQANNYTASLELLHQLQPRLAAFHENLSVLDFYSTLGESCRRAGRWDEAEAADRKAIEIFRAGLAHLKRPGDRLTWHHEGSTVYRSLAQLKLNENDAATALDVWESYRRDTLNLQTDNVSGVSMPPHGNFADKTTPVMPVGYRSSRNLNHPAALAFAALPDGFFGWIRANNTISAARMSVSTEEIRRLSLIFISQCSDRTSDVSDLFINGRHLFDVLLGPFMGALAKSDTLVIEPDDDLALLPFNALIDESGQYLNGTHDIVVTPGSSNHLGNPQSRSITNRDPILFVVAQSSSEVNSMRDPLADDEVKHIASLFRDPIIMKRGSKANFLQLLSQAFIFHYTGHSGTSVKGGRLFLAGSDPLPQMNEMAFYPGDIDSRMLRHCQLVVLSACQTDEGFGGYWLDRENLALAFLNAGVPKVVAANWKIDSSATTLMMTKFYELLLRGVEPARALRLAAEQVRHTEGYTHPYYWAGFGMLVNSAK